LRVGEWLKVDGQNRWEAKSKVIQVNPGKSKLIQPREGMIFRFEDYQIPKGARELAEAASFGRPFRFLAAARQRRLAVPREAVAFVRGCRRFKGESKVLAHGHHAESRQIQANPS
jgi:hypothetical protein